MLYLRNYVISTKLGTAFLIITVGRRTKVDKTISAMLKYNLRISLKKSSLKWERNITQYLIILYKLFDTIFDMVNIQRQTMYV